MLGVLSKSYFYATLMRPKGDQNKRRKKLPCAYVATPFQFANFIAIVH